MSISEIQFTNRLTIAIPVFERKIYFNDALNSVINQSVKCNIIVVDNNSSHNFFELESKKRGIKYFRNERNIGMFANWNRCIELAKTEFVMLLGDDDILSSTYVESFVKALDVHPEIDIYFSDYIYYDQDFNKNSNHPHKFPFGYMPDGKEIVNYAILYKLGFPFISSAIKKSKFTNFYVDFHASNEWLWIYSNANKLSFYGEKKVLLQYRRHDKQDTKSKIVVSDCRLSWAYILEEILVKSVCDKELINFAKKSAFKEILRIGINVNQNHLKYLLSSNSIYGNYLNKKFENNFWIRFYFFLPQKVSAGIFKLFEIFYFTKKELF